MRTEAVTSPGPVATATGEAERVRPDPARVTPEEMDRAVGLFKVLSHRDRLRLACALGDGRVTTQTELVEEFGWPQSTAARHVGALRSAGLITAERDGTEVLLRLGNPVALHLLDTVCAWVHAPASPPVGALEEVVGTSGAF